MKDDDFDKLLKAASAKFGRHLTLVAERTKCTICGHVIKPFYRDCPKCEGDRNREAVEREREIIRARNAANQQAQTSKKRGEL